MGSSFVYVCAPVFYVELRYRVMSFIYYCERKSIFSIVFLVYDAAMPLLRHYIYYCSVLRLLYSTVVFLYVVSLEYVLSDCI